MCKARPAGQARRGFPPGSIKRILNPQEYAMKNVLVITGSPRNNGNSASLARAFIEGAEAAGGKTMLFEAGKMNISGCAACNTCFSRGTACSYQDDFNALAPMLENADMIVFCTPLYWFTFPAQLKAAIDKFYSFYAAKKKLKIKEAVLIVCGGTEDTKDFEGIIKTYQLIVKHQGWKSREILIIPKVNEIGDIKNTGGLEAARNIGLSIL